MMGKETEVKIQTDEKANRDASVPKTCLSD